MTGLGIAVATPAVVFYNLAVRINRRVMYHANDRAHELLMRSAEMVVTQQPLTDRKSTVAQDPLAKGMHSNTADAQQATHYHSSASSQP